MVDTETTENVRAKAQAKAQLESIKEMLQALNDAYDSDSSDDKINLAYESLLSSALSVEVRSDWTPLGDCFKAAEYRILLCTGGPAVQIVGDLDAGGEPYAPALEYQDWFIPWASYPLDDKEEEALEDALFLYVRLILQDGLPLGQ